MSSSLIVGLIAIGISVPMLMWSIPKDTKGEWSWLNKAATVVSSLVGLMGVILLVLYGLEQYNIRRLLAGRAASVTANPLAGVVNTSNPVVQAVNTVVNNVRRLPPVLVNSVGNNRLRLGVPTQ
jgi:hypothetical protein